MPAVQPLQWLVTNQLAIEILNNERSQLLAFLASLPSDVLDSLLRVPLIPRSCFRSPPPTCTQAIRTLDRLDDTVLAHFALPNLMSLTLGGTTCTEVPILRAHDWSNLRQFSLSGAAWVGSVDEVVQHLVRTAQLVDLALAGCTELTDSAVKAVVRQCPDLESLDLTDCVLIEGSFATVIEEIGGCSLRRLILIGCTGISDLHIRTIVLSKAPLTELNLCHCLDVGTQTAQALQIGCRTLETLNLDGTRITSEGLKRALTGCPNLSSLSLKNCSQLSADASAACLRRAGLCRLTVEICSDVQAMAADDSGGLQILDLTVSTRPAAALTAAQGLSHLAVHGLPITADGAQGEATEEPWEPLVLHDQLAKLTLSHPSARIDSATVPNLVALDLHPRCVQLTDLPELLKQLPVLQELCVRRLDRAAPAQLMHYNANRAGWGLQLSSNSLQTLDVEMRDWSIELNVNVNTSVVCPKLTSLRLAHACLCSVLGPKLLTADFHEGVVSQASISQLADKSIELQSLAIGTLGPVEDEENAWDDTLLKLLTQRTEILHTLNAGRSLGSKTVSKAVMAKLSNLRALEFRGGVLGLHAKQMESVASAPLLHDLVLADHCAADSFGNSEGTIKKIQDLSVQNLNFAWSPAVDGDAGVDSFAKTNKDKKKKGKQQPDADCSTPESRGKKGKRGKKGNSGEEEDTPRSKGKAKAKKKGNSKRRGDSSDEDGEMTPMSKAPQSRNHTASAASQQKVRRVPQVECILSFMHLATLELSNCAFVTVALDAPNLMRCRFHNCKALIAADVRSRALLEFDAMQCPALCALAVCGHQWRQLKSCRMNRCTAVQEELLQDLAGHCKQLAYLEVVGTRAADVWRGKEQAEIEKNRRHRGVVGGSHGIENTSKKTKTTANLERIQKANPGLTVVWLPQQAKAKEIK